MFLLRMMEYELGFSCIAFTRAVDIKLRTRMIRYVPLFCVFCCGPWHTSGICVGMFSDEFATGYAGLGLRDAKFGKHMCLFHWCGHVFEIRVRISEGIGHGQFGSGARSASCGLGRPKFDIGILGEA